MCIVYVCNGAIVAITNNVIEYESMIARLTIAQLKIHKIEILSDS